MARIRDVLYRFRPAGSPGAAGAAGVPAVHEADLTAELEPLFARLAGTERECADIMERADHAAARTREHHAERARALVAAAREQVDGERAAAVARVRQHSEAESTAALVQARGEVAEVRRQAAQNLPAHVEAVVASVGRLTGAGQQAGQRGDDQHAGAL